MEAGVRHVTAEREQTWFTSEPGSKIIEKMLIPLLVEPVLLAEGAENGR
jgi:hypothetical protein